MIRTPGHTLNLISAALVFGCCGVATGAEAQTSRPATTTYYAYVGAESADLLHVVRFGPEGASVHTTFPVGIMAVDTEGPHGLRASPDGEFIYMTTGHGVPNGHLWKYHAGPDTLVAEPLMLGPFPATLDLTPDGRYLFAANFNLHGEHVPSTVSVVYTPDMVEMARIETCTMPHGARINAAGTRVYSACMMDDQIVEIDTNSWEVIRRFSVAKGAEGPLGENAGHGAHGASGGGGMADGAGAMTAPTCSPTWAQPSVDGARIYVACNAGDEILEIDAEDWTLLRRFPTGRGPYNLDLTADGRSLVASLKQGGKVEVFDLGRGESRGQVDSSARVTHGVAVTPDSRFAFVSVEGVGAEPGRVDIIDLETLELVGSVEVGQQAGGISFWRMGDPE